MGVRIPLSAPTGSELENGLALAPKLGVRFEPGSTVAVTTRLVEFDGRKPLFELARHEGEKLVGRGIHRRALVPTSS